MRTLGVCLQYAAGPRTGRAADAHRTIAFSDLRSLEDAANRGELSGALVELDALAEPRVERLLHIGTMLPLAIRLGPGPASLRYVAAAHAAPSHTFFSDSRTESLHAALTTLLEAPNSRGAQHLVLETLRAPLPRAVTPLLYQAALVTHQRTSVSRLARLCGVAPRTIEWRLAAHGLPAARRLLGMLTSLHAIWTMDMLGWSLKRAAAFTGFQSATSLSSYVRRHTGVRPAKCCDAGGVAALARSLAQLLGGVGPLDARHSADAGIRLRSTLTSNTPVSGGSHSAATAPALGVRVGIA